MLSNEIKMTETKNYDLLTRFQEDSELVRSWYFIFFSNNVLRNIFFKDLRRSFQTIRIVFLRRLKKSSQCFHLTEMKRISGRRKAKN